MTTVGRFVLLAGLVLLAVGAVLALTPVTNCGSVLNKAGYSFCGSGLDNRQALSLGCAATGLVLAVAGPLLFRSRR